MKFYVGVDVGTSSVRAGLVDGRGRVLRTCLRPINIWQPQPHFYVQSSADIWDACCHVVKDVTSGVEAPNVCGLGFDATCSLVVVDKGGIPLTVSPRGDAQHNVVMWLDHRASAEADVINATGHEVLEGYGGAISPEQEPPKILWLKTNLGDDWWRRVGHLFELPDFLTWKATGDASRSLCSLVCKWAYRSDPRGHGWDSDFYSRIGLGHLMQHDLSIVGDTVKSPGMSVGRGLSAAAAKQFGLVQGTPVATSMIDAHCGAIGMLGCRLSDAPATITSRVALICGTSTCLMAVSDQRLFVRGVWGPLYGVLLPGKWLHEGGQSASGKLVDHVIDSHAGAQSIRSRLADTKHVQDALNDILEKLRVKRGLASVSYLTDELHVWPDFHGNRSPLADPSLRGMVSGLSLGEVEEDLALLYLGVLQALAYGTRHILQELTRSGHSFSSMLMCGGLSKNLLFVRLNAEISGLPVVLPNETESVLLGGAMLAATSAGDCASLEHAMLSMGGDGNVVLPDFSTTQYHAKKFSVFLKMVEHQRVYRAIMAQ